MPTFTGADAATLYYDDPHADRSARPVIALAGGAAAHPDYLGDLAGLGQRERLVLPHLRGVGRSALPDPVEAASYWHQAEDLDRLRVHLGRQRAVVLGHSAGTRLAIAYAARFAERVAGLILITPPAAYLVDEPSDAPGMIDARRGDPAFDDAVAAWATGPPTPDDAGFTGWQHRVAPLAYAAWGEAERAHASSTRYSYAANRAYFSVDPPADLAARLGAVTAPVLVVAGAQDCTVGLAPVTALARLFPAGRLVVIDRCGHHPWVERPTAFRVAVDRFLLDLAAAGGA
jgi:pimeloyl-ACP methyl ester carboxylesterase